MRTNEIIRRVLGSALLSKNLSQVPSRGATEIEIANTELQTPHPLSDAFKGVIREWNGLNLDVVRICGVGTPDDGLETVISYLNDFDHLPFPFTAVASDPCGFVYGELPDGSILQWDHDGGDTKVVASSFEDFICNLVFGERAAEFLDEEWLRELRDNALSPPNNGMHPAARR